jgi:hypothetical protein
MRSDGQISAMVGRLRELRASDRAERLHDSVLRRIEDPLKPKTADGRIRINGILILWASLCGMATGTFLFFNTIRP